MSVHDNALLARAIYDAYNRDDFDAALSRATADVEIVTVAWDRTQRGHAGFRDFMRGWKAMAPDGRVEVVRQLAGEDGVTNECVFRGTHTGVLTTPNGDVPPTGKSFALPICEVWRVRDGKLAGLHLYADNVTILGQLGLMPAPAQAAT
jgi:steroid delta-isomerase-like uncharacterized protein